MRANFSQTKNATIATAAAISTGGPQLGSTCRPSGAGLYSPTTARPSATASSSPPTTSTFCGSSVSARAGRLKWIITIARAASGTLTQNTDCQ